VRGRKTPPKIGKPYRPKGDPTNQITVRSDQRKKELQSTTAKRWLERKTNFLGDCLSTTELSDIPETPWEEKHSQVSWTEGKSEERVDRAKKERDTESNRTLRRRSPSKSSKGKRMSEFGREGNMRLHKRKSCCEVRRQREESLI